MLQLGTSHAAAAPSGGGLDDLFGGGGGVSAVVPAATGYVPPKQVWLAAARGKGLEITGTFSRRMGVIYMEMTFSNRAMQPMNTFAIQLNKNSFGVAPAQPLQVCVSASAYMETAHAGAHAAASQFLCGHTNAVATKRTSDENGTAYESAGYSCRTCRSLSIVCV
jgi:hypothetical protein